MLMIDTLATGKTMLAQRRPMCASLLSFEAAALLRSAAGSSAIRAASSESAVQPMNEVTRILDAVG